ncbi:MAG: TetR/AcrR family transcriptional regulator [Pseudomonadota bacterium]
MRSGSSPKTLDALVDAGFRVLSRNPGANLADVAAAAGVTRATLHRYFPSRDALVDTLAGRAIEEMDAAVDAACQHSPSAMAAMRDCLFALVPLGDRHGFLAHEAVITNPTIEAEFERQQGELVALVDAAKRDGVLARDLPTDWIVRAYDYLIYAAWEAVRDQELVPKQAAEAAWRTFASGLGDSV